MKYPVWFYNLKSALFSSTYKDTTIKFSWSILLTSGFDKTSLSILRQFAQLYPVKSIITGLFKVLAAAMASSKSKKNSTPAISDSRISVYFFGLLYALVCDESTFPEVSWLFHISFSMLKSCVLFSGSHPLMPFKGAPHNPGIIYTVNASGIIAKNNLGTVRYGWP